MSKPKILNAEQSSDETQAAKTALKNFRILFSAVKTHFSMIQQSCEISGAQLWALHETHQHEGLTVGALAEKLSIKPTTASNLVEKLALAGYVLRERSPEDQRRVLLRCTAKGVDLLSRAPSSPEGILPAALSRLKQEDLNELNRLLGLLLAEFDIKDLTHGNQMISDL